MSKLDKTSKFLSVSQSQSEEGADSPLDIMYGETILMADVGEIEYHREAKELVAPLVDDGTPPRDDGLGEVVV